MAGIADAAVLSSLETIRDLVRDEVNLLSAVKGQAKKLQDELGHIQWLLKDAEFKKIDKERITKWIMEFRELAYDAEDVLESYAFKIESRKRQERGGIMKKSLRRCVGLPRKAWQTHKVGQQIQDLLYEISSLKDNFHKYGVRDVVEVKDGAIVCTKLMLRRSYSHVIEKDFVGLSDNVEMLVGHLIGNDLKFISISGMGGLGKTTLAQKIYNHPKVKDHFDASAWVCISQEFQKLDILQTILIKVFPTRRDEIRRMNDHELVREMRKFQDGRNCLFVLDDIWSTDAWELIKYAFLMQTTRIILTTRNKEVAVQINPTGLHYELPLLDEEDSWKLLQKKAFFNRGEGTCEGLESLGREMVKHCGGLPLAVIVLGGVLANKKSHEEWKSVHVNIREYLGKGNGTPQSHAETLDQIISLSYEDLPQRLKPCFLYMASFSEDVEIDAKLLYHLWMGEGLVSMEDRIGEEEVLINVAERYLGELAERCMVQVKTRRFPTIVELKSCRLHDIMRDLCLKKAKEENFLQNIKQISDHASSSSPPTSKIRRFIMTLDAKDMVRPSYTWPLSMENHARSLQLRVCVLDEDRCRALLPLIKSKVKDCEILRVLILDGLVQPLKEAGMNRFKVIFHELLDRFCIPKSIGKISHLRFLYVQNSEFWMVPSALGNLEHLQTLNLEGMYKLFISANGLQKMRELKYLYLPHSYVHFVPTIFGRYLRFYGLEKLEVLWNFNTNYCDAKDLLMLTNLRQLKVMMFTFGSLEVVINGINNFIHLRHLDMTIECSYNREKKVNNIFRYGCSILLRTLKRLEVYLTKINDDLVETLEKFPSLQGLALNQCSGVRELICSSNGFPQLIFLKLYNLYDLKNWRVDEGAMPNLSYLHITGCTELEMIPVGLRFITSLKELEIKDMPKEFCNRVRVVDGKEGADFDKIRHIPSITVKSLN